MAAPPPHSQTDLLRRATRGKTLVPRRSTPQTRDVLRVVLGRSGATYGYEIVRVTGLAPGTVYPILRRLEERGAIRGANEGRRRLYSPNRGSPVLAGILAPATSSPDSDTLRRQIRHSVIAEHESEIEWAVEYAGFKGDGWSDSEIRKHTGKSRSAITAAKSRLARAWGLE